ncbi:acyl dehydratase [Lipingzhangella halophila]|uniref:Acyl dehydratase n=1 Tax=Lipingzhangella halophila TaxID=1783352 RepID=A0A7W7RF88_9ACTN|nr:MaoC/PaaZ C-terminal domain-containing protein [Lipingzhangella halophila]MBB4930902.1 acyl dehydratase [Lipingzhangella halophila]
MNRSAEAAPGREHRVSQPTIDAFAEVSGGIAPIHTDPEYARSTPFGGTLVHGMYLVGLIERELCARAPGWDASGTVDVTFRRPVRAGEPFTIHLAGDPARDEEFGVTVRTENGTAVTGVVRGRPGRDDER